MTQRWSAHPNAPDVLGIRTAGSRDYQIPTLRHLTLEKINNFPAAALSLCCGPIDIALQDIDRLAQPSVDYSIQNPKITSLESSNCSIDGTLSVLLGPIGQNEAGTVMSIIEFDRLRDASFEISTQPEVIQTCKLLEKATCLEKLRIHVHRRKAWPVWIGSALAANPRPKLRCFTLALEGDFNEEDGDSILDEINHEIKKISAKNVLEVFEVHIKINFLGTRNGPLCDWTAWAADFDKTLIDAGAFPALRKVAVRLTWLVLDIPCAFFDRSPGELRKEHFPRLLGNTAIDFMFSDECDEYF